MSKFGAYFWYWTEKLWGGNGEAIVLLDYNVSFGPFLSYEIEIGDGPVPELDKYEYYEFFNPLCWVLNVFDFLESETREELNIKNFSNSIFISQPF